jgi:hypothetical protein
MNKKILRQIMSEIGKKGGTNSMRKRSKQERSEFGRRAVNIRWQRHRAEKQKVERYVAKNEQRENY